MPARLPLYFRPLVLARPFPAAQLNGNQEGPLRHGRRPRPGLPPQRSAMEGAWAQARRLRPLERRPLECLRGIREGPGEPGTNCRAASPDTGRQGSARFCVHAPFHGPCGEAGCGRACRGGRIFVHRFPCQILRRRPTGPATPPSRDRAPSGSSVPGPAIRTSSPSRAAPWSNAQEPSCSPARSWTKPPRAGRPRAAPSRTANP